MKKFGAQIVVYEDSGFLAETVLRIYPYMHKILFLVGLEPWNGKGDRQIPAATLQKITGMEDPDGKFVIVSRRWESEQQTRNEGLEILRDHGCDWCMIVDDDEMYNRSELFTMLGHISNAAWSNGRASAFIVKHLIYWRDRETVIDDLFGPFPTFVSLARGDVYFTEARLFQVLGGVWNDISETQLICHHFSYVRPEEQMRRKMSFFSHAKETAADWVDRIWVGWKPEMEDLHPTNSKSFKRAIPVASTPYRLELPPGRSWRRS